MPRTGGIYTPPAGTKGIPLTTILSSTFNAYVDDITADANAARPITAGGTGATSASGARTALGLEIGSDVQAQDPGLASIAGLTTTANQMLYTTAADAYATTALTPFARTILDDIDAAAARTTLGLVPGTNVQAYDAGLQSIAGLTTAANQMLYATAPDVYATTALTPFARTVLDDADAATARATLGANDAGNVTLGTLADARLPGVMSGKTFNGQVWINYAPNTVGGDNLILRPTDYGVGKPGLFFSQVAGTAFWNIGLWDTATSGGGVRINSTTLTHNGATIWTSANGGPGSNLNADLLDGQHGAFYQNVGNATGTLPTASLPLAMGSGKTFDTHIYLNGSGAEKVLWYQHNGTTRGAAFWRTSDASLNWNLYNPSGAGVRNMSWREADGRFYLEGFIQTTERIAVGTTGSVIYTDGNTAFSGGMATVHGASLYDALNARIKNDGGTYGINITGNAATVGGLAASAFKRASSTSNNVNETNFPIGHIVIAEGLINRNQAANVYLHGSLAYGYQVSPVGAGTICAGTWLARGGSSVGAGFTELERIT
ncbi:hypothetical protein [Shinella sp. G-2]|uniref:hypothetical protein n=1 Tax=Shinella sp. G-2 TaxID=3133141 RepID=UPI003D06433C